MGHKGPGKSHREGISFLDVVRMFPDDKAAEAWFIGIFWPDGPSCPHCGSTNVLSGAKHKTMPYRCREKGCRKRFSLRTGTIMESSKLGFQTWAIAIYLLTTGIKGVASMKLHRDLNVTQKTAWFLAHRIRGAWQRDGDPNLVGPVEIDETMIGGKEKNKHADKKLHENWYAGKAIVAGAKDRESGKINARMIDTADAKTLKGFVDAHAAEGATVYTDEAKGYQGIPYIHETVNHSAGEYANGQASTNGIQGFWALLKRGYQGVYHHMSPKHLDRYIAEFTGRHNWRELDTRDQMRAIAKHMIGKRLKYRELVA